MISWLLALLASSQVPYELLALVYIGALWFFFFFFAGCYADKNVYMSASAEVKSCRLNVLSCSC